MDSCIIAINSGHERIMGYAACQRNGNMALRSSNVPVIKGKNVLVGVTGNEELLNDFKISPLLLNADIKPHVAVDVIRIKMHIKGYDFLPEVLVLTSNNFIYHWTGGKVNVYSETDEGYLAIGPGSEIAMGAIYGLRSSRYTITEQAEVAIKAVSRYYPELGRSTGVVSL